MNAVTLGKASGVAEVRVRQLHPDYIGLECSGTGTLFSNASTVVSAFNKGNLIPFRGGVYDARGNLREGFGEALLTDLTVTFGKSEWGVSFVLPDGCLYADVLPDDLSGYPSEVIAALHTYGLEEAQVTPYGDGRHIRGLEAALRAARELREREVKP